MIWVVVFVGLGCFVLGSVMTKLAEQQKLHNSELAFARVNEELKWRNREVQDLARRLEGRDA